MFIGPIDPVKSPPVARQRSVGSILTDVFPVAVFGPARRRLCRQENVAHGTRIGAMLTAKNNAVKLDESARPPGGGTQKFGVENVAALGVHDGRAGRHIEADRRATISQYGRFA